MNNILKFNNFNLGKTLLNDSFWAVFGNVVLKGLGLLGGIIVARFLGKNAFGEFGIIKNTLMSIAVFSTFGLGYTATKYIAEFSKKRKGYTNQIIENSIKITFGFSGVMALFLFFGADYIANEILDNSKLSLILKYTSIWVIFNAYNTTQIGVLSGFGVFKSMAKINFSIGVITFVATSVLTYFYLLTGALIALVFSQIINCIFNYILLKRVRAKKDVQKKVYLEELSLAALLKFSLPIALQEGVFSVSNWLLSLIIIKYASYGELGVYSAAIQWSTIVIFIPAILRNVVLSHLSSTNHDSKEHHKVLNVLLVFNFIVVFIPCILIYIMSGYIASIYGNSFEGLKDILNIAVFSVVPLSVGSIYIQAFISKGANWLVFVMKFVSFIFTICLSYFLIVEKGNSASFNVYLASLIVNVFYVTILSIIYNRYYKN